MADPFTLQAEDGFIAGRFSAMASPCEVLLDGDDAALARRLTAIACREAQRIERKFSRYRDDNIVHRVNGGGRTEVDAETANLLDYADRCFELSEGLFDITSGALRDVWCFDGGDRVPSGEAVTGVLERVGWQKVAWRRPVITLPEGMEIDLGGIGKEYAVDRVVQLLRQHTDTSLVVNFGGDLFATGPRSNGRPWLVAVEDPRRGGAGPASLSVNSGGLATSGDARRFLLRDGERYGHILDPRSGWPVRGAPPSVTVWGETCMAAGMMATFAILQGDGAERFLSDQGLPFWII